MMKFFKNEKFILILIILLAATLRLVSLDKIPLSLHHDEELSSYEAYSILTTGQDQWGDSFPLRFKAFGDYVPPLYFYFNVPFVLIFGLTEWAVRIPAAVLGILTVWLTYLLTKELFKNKNIALGAAFLLSISPWHFHYSRLGFPAIMLPFLVSLGLWLFFKGLNKQKFWLLALGIFSLSLTVWVYTPAQVFTPLLLLGLLFFYHRQLSKKKIFFCLIIGLIILSPLYLLATAHPEWQTRFNQISILKNSPAWLVGPLFLVNYLLHLDPNFLFLNGDANLRHKVLGVGQLYIFESIFIVTALVIFLLDKKRRLPNTKFLIYWLLIFPISAAMTQELLPHATRTIVALPLFSILSSVGIYYLYKILKENITNKLILKIIYSSFFLVVLVSSFSFFINYFKFYPKYSASWFNYGEKELVQYIKENYNQYDKIVFYSKKPQPYLNFLFYWPYPLNKFRQEVKTDKEVEKFWGVILVRSFGKIEFKFDWEKIKDEKLLPKTLYVEDQTNLINLPIKKIIYFPDGSTAFRLMAL